MGRSGLPVVTIWGHWRLALSGDLRYKGEGSHFGVGLEEFYRKGFIHKRQASTRSEDMFDQEFVARTWADMEKIPRANWNHAHLLVWELSQNDPKSLLVRIRKSI